MFGKTISLFKLFGFEVKIDLSWIIIALLITWSLAKGVFPTYYKGLSTTTYWWMGIFGALCLFFSITIIQRKSNEIYFGFLWNFYGRGQKIPITY